MANTTVSTTILTLPIPGAPTVTIPSIFAQALTDAFAGATAANTALETLTGGTLFLSPNDKYAIIDVPAGDTVTVEGNATAAAQYLFTGGGNVVFDGTGPTTGAAGSAGTIFLTGTGSDTLNDTGSYTVDDPGKNYINFHAGSPLLNATGATFDHVTIGDATATIDASGAATVSVHFAPNSGGSLDFINNSDQSASVYAGADNAVTAFGGAGGGFYAGGLAGNNSLVGGIGTVTLVGGGNNDFLEANASVGTNVLVGGAGVETLIGSSTSGANDFYLGLKGSIAGYDVVSTSGTGAQDFKLGTGAFTITGSDAVSTSSQFANVYDVVRDASVGGLNLTITNFTTRDVVLFTNATETAGSATFNSVSTDNFGGTQITLSDRTTIDLVGVDPNKINLVAGLHGIVGFTEK